MTHGLTRSIVALTFALAAPLAAQQSQEDPAADAQARPDPASPPPAEPDAGEAGANTYPHLAARLAEMGVPVIDVRTTEELEETGMIDGAVHLPRTDPDAIAERIGEDRDRAVVLYGATGRGVASVIDQLRERGFSGLVNAGAHEELTDAIEGADEAAE
jgi:phage shock protein E